jgi:hypothetical protein
MQLYNTHIYTEVFVSKQVCVYFVHLSLHLLESMRVLAALIWVAFAGLLENTWSGYNSAFYFIFKYSYGINGIE